MESVVENGKWRHGQDNGRVYVESDDFTHDVRLYVNGDFASNEQKLAYAAEIASRLNSV